MSSLCRVCLAGNLELNSLENNQLILFYEKLLETKFYSEDARPTAMCCFCYEELLRCHKFSQIAHRSEEIFSQLVHQGLEATQEKITELNLGMEQQLSVGTMQLIMIKKDQDEPILVKEEMTTEEVPLEDVESLSHEDCTKTEDIDRETDVEELFPNMDVEQAQPDNFTKTICCNYCSKVFFHKNTLIAHIRKSHSHFQEKDNQNIHLLNHMTTYTGEKPFACNLCDIKLSYKCDIEKHLRCHTGEKPFGCYVCGKHFNRKNCLVSHMRIHSGEKPFACNLCGKQFSNKSNLKRHESNHTGEKPFGCNVCDKYFNRKHGLVEHMRTHTGEKPFACKVCDKKFSYKCDLVTHTICHTGEKLFACNVCDKHFNHRSSLDRHNKTHTGDLVNQIICHTGEKLFACNVCNKHFNHKSSLDRHNKIHTGERPFPCNVCDKHFIHKSSLLKHMKCHAGEKPFACNV